MERDLTSVIFRNFEDTHLIHISARAASSQYLGKPDFTVDNAYA